MRRSAMLLLLLVSACSQGYGRGELSPSETDALRETLRAYMSAQEVHYSRHSTYSSDLGVLGVSTDGSTIEVLSADAQGHAAIVTHDEHGDDVGCAVFVGSATPPRTPHGLETTEEGRVVCDAGAD